LHRIGSHETKERSSCLLALLFLFADLLALLHVDLAWGGE
jgi:hypothetical protein